MINSTKFKELMAEKGIKSVRELSILTKVPYTTICYMLSGHDVHLSTIVQIAKFFDVPVDYLILKSYGVVMYSEKTSKYIDTSNLIEATALWMF